MMNFLVAQEVPEDYVPMMLEEMELDGVDHRSDAWGDEVDPDRRAHHKVLVIGAGVAGLQAIATAKRLGAKNVICLYRRTRDESPARLEELEHAEEEDIDFRWLSSPVEIYGNEEGLVTGARVQVMELGEPDDSGRRRPVPIEGEQYDIELDQLVMGIGQGPNPVVTKSTKGLELNRWGNIVVDEAESLGYPFVKLSKPLRHGDQETTTGR